MRSTRPTSSNRGRPSLSSNAEPHHRGRRAPKARRPEDGEIAGRHLLVGGDGALRCGAGTARTALALPPLLLESLVQAAPLFLVATLSARSEEGRGENRDAGDPQ